MNDEESEAKEKLNKILHGLEMDMERLSPERAKLVYENMLQKVQSRIKGVGKEIDKHYSIIGAQKEGLNAYMKMRAEINDKIARVQKKIEGGTGEAGSDQK